MIFFLCDQVTIVYQDTQNEGTQVSHRNCLGKPLYHGQHFLILQSVEPLESPEIILSLSQVQHSLFHRSQQKGARKALCSSLVGERFPCLISA